MSSRIDTLAKIDFNATMCALEETAAWLINQAEKQIEDERFPLLTYAIPFLTMAYELLTENFGPDDCEETLYKRYDQAYHATLAYIPKFGPGLMDELEAIKLSRELVEGYQAVLGSYDEKDPCPDVTDEPPT